MDRTFQSFGSPRRATTTARWRAGLLIAGCLALPAFAADYTDGVAVSGNTATLWFKSTVNTTWVDAHYTV